MLIRKHGDWVDTRIDDQILMISVESGTYVGLKGVGARIWELLDQARTTSELCDLLVIEYDIDALTCEVEVSNFIDQLIAQKAVIVEPAVLPDLA